MYQMKMYQERLIEISKGVHCYSFATELRRLTLKPFIERKELPAWQLKQGIVWTQTRGIHSTKLKPSLLAGRASYYNILKSDRIIEVYQNLAQRGKDSQCGSCTSKSLHMLKWFSKYILFIVYLMGRKNKFSKNLLHVYFCAQYYFFLSQWGDRGGTTALWRDTISSSN